jgi:hypothetical protein
MSFEGREKGGNGKQKGNRKRKKGKESEKMASKRFFKMHTMEELRQKGYHKSKKNKLLREGKNIISERGAVNIIFGPKKYRPLPYSELRTRVAEKENFKTVPVPTLYPITIAITEILRIFRDVLTLFAAFLRGPPTQKTENRRTADSVVNPNLREGLV